MDTLAKCLEYDSALTQSSSMESIAGSRKTTLGHRLCMSRDLTLFFLETKYLASRLAVGGKSSIGAIPIILLLILLLLLPLLLAL
jgi:hypothetical protein